jgi:transcriptional regulator with XRE-family HTH domain
MKNQKADADGRARSPLILNEGPNGGPNGVSDPFDSGDTEMAQAVEVKLTELKKRFGRNLARIRKDAGYSQLALSIEVDLTHNFINELEQGIKGASFETLARLSFVLRTPVHQFFEPFEETPSQDDFQYPQGIDLLIAELHEAIDVWNDKRTK